MDTLKTSLDWTKDELFSTPFFIYFGIIFLIASIGFWQLGKTDLAKAYIVPTLITGLLLMIIGSGLYGNNRVRMKHFEKQYLENPSAFVASEIMRTKDTLEEYQLVVFKIIPIIIAVSALGIIFLNSPMMRAIFITTIALMIVLLLVDGTAHARIKDYHQKLLISAEDETF